MENEKKDVELLMLRVEQMRQAQQQYFKLKGATWLRASKAKEQAVDDLLKQYRRKGYNPQEQENNSEQKSIF